MNRFFRHVSLVVLALASARSAKALTFNITYDSTVTSLTNAAQVEAAFAYAAQTFSTIYTNPITVNLGVSWGTSAAFPYGVGLGASSASLYGIFTYNQIIGAMLASRKSPADFTSMASVPNTDPTGSDRWFTTTSQDKALGLGINPNDPGIDGEIGFSSSATYTFDPNNRAVPGAYDFIGVAEHEISEVLGRSAGLRQTALAYTPFDLFRFTSSFNRTLDANSTGVYFSIDNGVTNLKAYNPPGGGDLQDWASGAIRDTYDAFGSIGMMMELSGVDIITLDVIGYDLAAPTAPLLTGAALADGSFRFSFTNSPGATFTAFATTNLSLPRTNWTVLGATVEEPAGQFQFTDPLSTNQQRFYEVRSP